MKFLEKKSVYFTLQAMVFLLGGFLLFVIATQFLDTMIEMGRTLEYNAMMDQTSQYFW